MSGGPAELDRCGCCEGDAPDEPVRNAPALPALRYRLATHSRFLERMLHGLPRSIGATPDERPLTRLTSRTGDDVGVALLDAAAVVADVVTFYQERIANEGYLRTATERQSVLELARAIGYELGPGVAASVHLSFVVEDAPGAPLVCTLPAGTQVQSVPPEGKLPQLFETSASFVARAEWNALRPRLTRPAELAIMDDSGSPGLQRLYLLGPAGTFPDSEPGLLKGLDAATLHRLDVTPPSEATVDALEVRRIYLSDAAAGLAKGDLLLFAGRHGTDTDVLVLRVADVVEESALKRVRVDLEALPAPNEPEPEPTGAIRFPYLTRLSSVFATVGLARLPFNHEIVTGSVLSRKWREHDLQAMIGVQGWRSTLLERVINRRQNAPPLDLDAGAFAFRERAAFFGHTAPRWKTLPLPASTHGNAYPQGWDHEDDGAGSPPASLPHERTVWTNSQGTANPAAGPHAYLERPMKGLVQRSWVVFESPDVGFEAYTVEDARDASRADFGISGRAMGLTLRTAQRARVDPATIRTTKPFGFRTSTAHAASRRLEFVELPIETPVESGTTQIELDRMVLGLTVDQPVALTGTRSDLPGAEAAEIALLREIVHDGGRTTLFLRRGLQYSYVRESLTISANVVHATHGETVSEVLGSGDGTVANQRFDLKKPPLTYISAPTPSGAKSTLEVRVNRVRWDEVPSLYPEPPSREAYVVRIGDDLRASVILGDGNHGARVPTGMANVMATYRSGTGLDGEVDAGTLTLLRTIPLGLRSVSNAVPARGAENPERLAYARVNAPLTVLTFERVVSQQDYEDFARAFPGLGKARADRLWVGGRDVVHVTIAAASGGDPGADVLGHLVEAMAAGSDGSQRFVVNPFAQRYFTVRARIAVDPRRVVDDVLEAVRLHLRDAYSFERRDFAQSVTPSEVVARMHDVEGVVAVDLDVLAAYDEGGTTVAGPPAPVPARRARWNAARRNYEPAELLLINPVGIDLAEMV